LVFTGNAVSDGTVPFAFLPGGFRQVAPWLPNGAIVSAARDVTYLPASSLAHPLLVLGIWLAASLAVLAAVDLLHLAERRRTPEQQADIYATPGTTHLRRRLTRQRTAALETLAHLAYRSSRSRQRLSPSTIRRGARAREAWDSAGRSAWRVPVLR
jgi:hypothetical protein